MSANFRQKNMDGFQTMYSHVFNHLSDLVVLLDVDGNIVDINLAAKKYYNCVQDQVVGEKFEFLSEKITHRSRLQKNTALKNAQYVSIDWKTIDLKNNQNDFYGFLLIGEDITDKLKIESQAREIQNYLERISSCMPGNFYWKNKEGRYLGCNTSLLKILGLKSVEDIIGKTDDDLWPEQAVQLRKHDQKVMGSGELYYLEEIVNMPLSKGKMYFTVIKMPLFDENKNVVGIIGNSLDITELKNTQLELKKAKEFAENLSKAKSEFIANMSHDVKTPIAGIIGLSEVLKKELSGNANNLVQDILSCAEELMSFFDNCLAMSKSDAIDLVLVKEEFNLKALLHRVIKLFYPAIENKNLDFNIYYDSRIPDFLLGSAVAIYRILMNLLGNAVKFTETGGVHIHAALGKKSTSEKVIIKLSIKDSGIGIPEDKQTLIFEQFTRLTPSYQGIYTGSGIGLFVVNKLVKSLNGEIYLKSEESKGSEFTVVLPLDVPLLDQSEYGDNRLDLSIYEAFNVYKARQSHPQNFEMFNSIQPPLKQTLSRVLLVEDSRIAQRVGKSVLSALNCEVDVAENGNRALKYFEQGKYDLVFMDIGLPDMDGDKVAQKFREIEKASAYPAVPIIGLTAHPLENIVAVCESAGMQSVLSKPLSSGQAFELLNRYVYSQKIDSETPKLINGMVKDLPASESALFQLEIYPLLDLKEALKLAGNEVALREMLQLLVAEVIPEELSHLANSYAQKNWDSIKGIAHKLKGSALYLGTLRMRYACQYLERYKKTGQDALLDELYRQCVVVLEETQKHVEAWLLPVHPSIATVASMQSPEQ
jgi:two-component system, OmpR family, aerobic respiration control sensor histidine kinase ArcB